MYKTSEPPQTNPLIFLMLVVLAGVIGYFFMVNVLQIRFTDHALTSHPAQVKYIDNCFENGGTITGPLKTDHGRMSEYCQDSDDRVYWRIFTCQEGDKLVITQFMQYANRVVNYVANHGMRPIEGEIGC